MHKPHISFGRARLTTLLLSATLMATPTIATLANTHQTATATTLEQAQAPAAGESVTQDVEYLERSWDGTQVCEQVKARSNARTLPADGCLDSHCYVVDRDMTLDAPIRVIGDARLVVCDGCTLSAQSGIDVDGTLDIYGDGGRIVADGTASDVPGIGGTGSLTIHGGSIEATGGRLCPGIGAQRGMGNSSFRATVYGGDIVATGGPCAAGVGGGEASTSGMVHVYGGKLTAIGGKLAAGIGDGNGLDETVRNNNDGEIKIWGGEVEATGGEQAAGIGSGADGSFGTIAIHGGTVTANGGYNGSGIGGWREDTDDDNTILIDGGTITANGGACGDGIANSSNGTVSLLGGNVSAFSCKGTAVAPTSDDSATSNKADNYGLAVNGTLEIGSHAHGSIDSLYADRGTLELGTTLRFGERSSIKPGHYAFGDRFADSLDDVEF